jgi:uncharacterized SAM-binding protein YcdF (DUF218 family)
VAESGVAPPAVPRRRRRLLWVAAGLLAVAWLLHRPALVAVGSLLVTEDPFAPVDVVILSNASVRAGALEGLTLYREGHAPRLALLQWRTELVDAALRREGIRVLDPTALARSILEQGGVPGDVITVLPGPVDGTGTEIAAILRWVGSGAPRSLLYVTARSHTTRARLRLRHEVPDDVRVDVRASRWDTFDPKTWWRRRASTREVLAEYTRWINTFVLGDLWRRRLAPPS